MLTANLTVTDPAEPYRQTEFVEHLVAQLLLSAASHLPNKKIAYRHVQYDALDMVRMLDYVLVAHNSMMDGINVWARLLPLLDVPVEVKARRTDTSLTLLFQGCDTVPPWLFYLVQALHVRLLTLSLPPVWSWDPGSGKLDVPLPGKLKIAIPIVRDDQGVSLTLPRPLLLQRYVLPLPSIGELLVQFLDWLTPESFGKFGTVDAIKQQMVSLLPRIPTIEALADHLCISARTLQRRLRQQGYTYSQLSDEVRYAEAMRLLATTVARVSDIAHQLGFSEASSFQRSFRRWHSVSPSQYRAQLRVDPQHLGDELPLQLFYAENRMREQRLIVRRTARVWLLVSNLGFEKEVRVRCLDMDGLYREYDASFECFISPKLELWATANLPVAEPLHFMTSLRVAGRYYVDDNHGAGYRLDSEEQILLGQRELVHPQSHLQSVGEQRWLLCGSLYRPITHTTTLFILLKEDMHKKHPVHAVFSASKQVSIFHFSIQIVDPDVSYFIVEKNKNGDENIIDGPFSATYI